SLLPCLDTELNFRPARACSICFAETPESMRGSFTFAAAMVWEREVASKYLLAISTSGSSGILTPAGTS
ncbi:MAG: hypothetical protein LUQ44_02815, partial [Methanothrix sp.]|nr:hypothetical protein [Methanothrix sp.]